MWVLGTQSLKEERRLCGQGLLQLRTGFGMPFIQSSITSPNQLSVPNLRRYFNSHLFLESSASHYKVDVLSSQKGKPPLA